MDILKNNLLLDPPLETPQGLKFHETETV